MILLLLLTFVVRVLIDDESSLNRLVEAVERGELTQAKSILTANSKNAMGHRAEVMETLNQSLRTAAKCGNAEMAKLLIDHGADVRARDTSGNTPLHEAAGKDVAKLLVSRGAKWDVINNNRQTPTSYAAERGHKHVVLTLQHAGARLDYESAVKAGLVQEVAPILAKEPWLPKRPSTSIFDVVRTKDVVLVKLLLQHGADPNLAAGFVNIPGRYTPLSEAVIDNEYQIALQLCNAGAEANVSGGRNHGNLLLYCIAFREPRFVELLLKHGASVSVKEDAFFGVKGSTPLHVAAALGGMEDTSGYMRVGEPDHANSKHEWAAAKVTALLKAQADPNARMEGGSTPLHQALLAQNHEAVKVLLNAGAVVDMCAACALGRLDEVTAHLEKEPKAVTQTNICGWPPLYWAILSGKVSIVERILKSGGEPNKAAGILEYHPASGFGKSVNRDERNQTLSPLSLAIQMGHVDIVRLLLKYHAAVDGDHEESNTPTVRACWGGNREMLMLLLNHHPQLNLARKNGTPPLAAAVKDRKLIEILLAHGADPNCHVDGDSLLTYVAKSEEYRHIGEVLIANGAKHDMESACIMNKVDIVRSMLNKNPALANMPFGSSDECPLETAIEAGAEDVAMELLEKGAIFKSKYYGNDALLSIVARIGMKRVAERLLKAGANINALDSSKSAALHHAANQGQASMIQFLIDHGANVNLRDGRAGDTPLHCCSKTNYWRGKVSDEARRKTAEALLQAGAKIDARNGTGQLPLHSAADHGELGLVKLFVERNALVNVTDWHDQSPLDLTRRDRYVFREKERKDFTPIQEYLRQHGAK